MHYYRFLPLIGFFGIAPPVSWPLTSYKEIRTNQPLICLAFRSTPLSAPVEPCFFLRKNLVIFSTRVEAIFYVWTCDICMWNRDKSCLKLQHLCKIVTFFLWNCNVWVWNCLHLAAPQTYFTLVNKIWKLPLWDQSIVWNYFILSTCNLWKIHHQPVIAFLILLFF